MLRAPQAWTELVNAFRRADVAQYEVRHATCQQARDAAIVEQTRAMDAMFLAMTRLSETGDMTRVTLMLARKVAA